MCAFAVAEEDKAKLARVSFYLAAVSVQRRQVTPLTTGVLSILPMVDKWMDAGHVLHLAATIKDTSASPCCSGSVVHEIMSCIGDTEHVLSEPLQRSGDILARVA